MKTKLTEDERLRRQAERRAAKINARIAANAGPLFAEQIPAEELASPQEEYWKIRHTWAASPRGHEAAYLAGVDWKWDLFIIRNLARRVMPPEDFALAVEKDDKYGDRIQFWKTILLGRRRIVISYWRHVFGCKSIHRDDRPPFFIEKRIEIGEERVWPPPGYQPPLTPDELDRHLALPLPLDFPGAVDPLGLGA